MKSGVVYDMGKVEPLMLIYSYINDLPQHADDTHTHTHMNKWLLLDSFILLYIYTSF